MKYIDADKLIAEVKERGRRCETIANRDNDFYYRGKSVAYWEAANLITSLCQERPKAEWSELDDLYRDNIMAYLNLRKDKNLPEDTKYPVLDAWIDWLKSLRPQPHWKPTRAMLDSLKWAKSEFHPDCPKVMANLNYLYNDLKQL